MQLHLTGKLALSLFSLVQVNYCGMRDTFILLLHYTHSLTEYSLIELTMLSRVTRTVQVNASTSTSLLAPSLLDIFSLSHLSHLGRAFLYSLFIDLFILVSSSLSTTSDFHSDASTVSSIAFHLFNLYINTTTTVSLLHSTSLSTNSVSSGKKVQSI